MHVLARFPWIACETRGKLNLNLDLKKKTKNTSSHLAFFCKRFVGLQQGQPYNNTDTTTAWQIPRFISSERLDSPIVEKPVKAVNAYVYVAIALGRWDIATEVYEVIYKFQKLTPKLETIHSPQSTITYSNNNSKQYSFKFIAINCTLLINQRVYIYIYSTTPSYEQDATLS